MEINKVTICKFNVITKSETLSNLSLPTFESLKIIKNFPFDLNLLSQYYRTDSNTIDFSSLNIEDINIVKAFLKMFGLSDIKENQLETLKDNDYNNFLNEELSKQVADSLQILKLRRIFETFINQFGYIDNNNFLNELKNSIFSLNQILILISVSNILWIKEEEKIINKTDYDVELNRFNFIFFNKDFIENKLVRLYKHPRCELGFLSSMVDKNINLCVSSLETKFKYFKTSFKDSYVNQSYHDNLTSKDDKNAKPIFKRNMKRILVKFKKYRENNIVILEAEKDKIYEGDENQEKSTKYNSIILNIFEKEHFYKSSDQKIKLDKEVERNIDYLLNLLNNCEDDVREYLLKNPRDNHK